MKNKLLAGMCIMVLLVISTASALRTSGTVAEASSISRLTGNNPYDMINQLDTKQINKLIGYAMCEMLKCEALALVERVGVGPVTS